MWLRDIADGRVALPDAVSVVGAHAETGGRDQNRAADSLAQDYERVFADIDVLREMSDNRIMAVHQHLERALKDRSADFPNTSREGARAVFSEIDRERALRPQARMLSAQRKLDNAVASAPDVSAVQRIELAAQVREHATKWFGAETDCETAFEGLARADRQYTDTVLDASPLA
jgi:hypothetical protein